MRRRTPIAAALGLSLGLFASAPALAQVSPGATRLQVDTTADTVDAVPGDGVCADASSSCSLRAAVQEANALAGEQSISLGQVTYRLSLSGAGNDTAASGDLDVSSPITILGNGAEIDSAGLGDRSFDVSTGGNLTVEGVQVQNSSAPDTESGGAFRSAGTLQLDRVIAVGNIASGMGASGGAVANIGGNLVVNRGAMVGNKASRAGGAIEANAGTTSINNALIVANSAGDSPGNGGGFHLTGEGTVNVNASGFVANTASAEGGALWNSEVGTMTVTGSILSANKANGTDADQGGGGLYNDGGSLSVQGGNIADNTATSGSGSGGGILNNGGQLAINGTTITRNSTARAGGAVETKGGTVSIDRSALSANAAGPMPGNGGALHVSGAATVKINSTFVVDNTAANEGGGLWNSAAGTMNIDKTYVLQNTASGDQSDEGGGGIFNQSNEDGTGGGTLTTNLTWIVNNSAPVGSGSGGGVLNERGDVTLTGTIIAGNSSARAGGGVEAVGGTETNLVGTTVLDDVLLFSNTTGPMPGNGGGLHLTGAGTVNIDGSRVFTNSAVNEGGGLWNFPTGKMTVTNTPVTSNTVGVSGNGPNVFQKGPVNGGTLTLDGNAVAEGPNTLL